MDNNPLDFRMREAGWEGGGVVCYDSLQAGNGGGGKAEGVQGGCPVG